MIVLAGLIAMCVIALLTLAASAQQRICGPEQIILSQIFAEHGEVEIWRGQANVGEAVMTAAPDGSWTILAVNNGIACIVSGGLTSEFDRGV